MGLSDKFRRMSMQASIEKFIEDNSIKNVGKNDYHYIFSFFLNFDQDGIGYYFEENVINSYEQKVCDEDFYIKGKDEFVDWMQKTKYCLKLIDTNYGNYDYCMLTCELVKELEIFSLFDGYDYSKIVEFSSLCHYAVFDGGLCQVSDHYDTYDSLKKLYHNMFQEIKSISDDPLIQKRTLLQFTSDATKLIKEGKYDEFRLMFGASV